MSPAINQEHSPFKEDLSRHDGLELREGGRAMVKQQAECDSEKGRLLKLVLLQEHEFHGGDGTEPQWLDCAPGPATRMMLASQKSFA